MCAKSIAAVAVVVVLGLVGCVTTPQTPDMERKLGPQPTMSADVRAEFVGKSVRNYRFYISSEVTYRVIDIPAFEEALARGLGDKSIPVTDDVYFHPTDKPPESWVAHTNLILGAVKKKLESMGVGVAESLCDHCFTIKLQDYAEWKRRTRSFFGLIEESFFLVQIAPKVFRGGKEVARARDDWRVQAQPEHAFDLKPDKVAEYVAKRVVEEVMFALRAGLGMVIPPDPPQRK